VLPFTADFRWLILAFHKLFSVLPAEKPERARITMKRLVSRRGWRYFMDSLTSAMPGCALALWESLSKCR
jgi:hypothetical protein